MTMEETVELVCGSGVWRAVRGHGRPAHEGLQRWKSGSSETAGRNDLEVASKRKRSVQKWSTNQLFVALAC